MNKRPEIKKITVEFTGGKKREIIINDPAKDLPEAIFFGNLGVEKMLTPFYKANPGKNVKKGNVKTWWSKEAVDKIFGAGAPDDEEVEINEQVIDSAWNTLDAGGESTAMLVKKPGCPLE
jgi:hypothetical protein